MNTFGQALRVSTFGESHGVAVGCVIDGFPAGVEIDEKFIALEMQRRKGGQTPYATPRKEDDQVQILSGMFDGKSTGAPIAILIANTNTKSKDYAAIANLFRPGHADFTYWHKYGIRDYRGGGRSSARESAARVASGAFAKLLLRELGVVCESGILHIGRCEGREIDFAHARGSEIFALDKHQEKAQKQAILEARKRGDSIGGCALVRAYSMTNAPYNALLGLGEPLYHKLSGSIGSMMMGLNGVKALEIGDGIESSKRHGSENNDSLDSHGFKSNRCGGILGGIGTGEEIRVKVYFKPTPSIFLPQATIEQTPIGTDASERELVLKGRHDPCIAVRGSVVCESMLALILADMALLRMGNRLESIKAFYASK